MDEGKSCAAQLINLSKRFDCIVRDFLIAKLEEYEALKVMCKVIAYRWKTYN